MLAADARSKVFTSLLVLSVFGSGVVRGAGCFGERCGIPCYLRDAEDSCHYRTRDQLECTGDVEGVKEQLQQLNKSLSDLEDRLVKRGVIPPGDTCPELPPIPHGGVIYSDLTLVPGVSARYVCDERYSLHGYGEYNCSEEGVWSGNTSNVPSCEVSLKACKSLTSIPHGHVAYQTIDTPTVLPGDVALYSCDAPYSLLGSEYRICLWNGSWSDSEPLCVDLQRNESVQSQIASETGGLTGHLLNQLQVSKQGQLSDMLNYQGAENEGSMIGLNVGLVLTTVVLAVTVVVMGIMIVRRCRRPKTVRSISVKDEEYVPIDMQHLLTSGDAPARLSSDISLDESKLTSREQNIDTKPEERIETLRAEGAL